MMLKAGVLQQAADDVRFQSLLESAPDAIVIVDADGRIVIANSQAEQLFGYRHDELLLQPVELLLPTRLRALHERHRRSYVGEPHTRPMGVGLDLVARRKDGSTFPVEISLSPLHTDGGLLVTSVIRDVTDRKEAADELERQVQRRTAHLNTLLQFSQELLGARSLDAVLERALNHALALLPQAQCAAIYLAESDNLGLALRASASFRQLPVLNVPPHASLVGTAFRSGEVQLIDESADTEVSPVEALTSLAQALRLNELPGGALAIPLLAHAQTIGVLLLLRHHVSDGFDSEACSTLLGVANLAAAAIMEERSAHRAATLTSRVTTLEAQQQAMSERLTAAEAAMLQAARLAAVGQLAAAIAHEINNPLYAARNCLYLIEQEFPAQALDDQYLQIAREQLTRIAGIIERMRDFYRPTRGEMAPQSVNQLLEETLTITGLNTRYVAIDVIFAPQEDLTAVVCNGDQLRQVFLNLILNAIDAMDDGGTLTIRTIGGPRVAVIEIRDTGIGIPADVRERLFEPFYTTKSNGTGLGLSISAHIITQHGGQIEVDSTEGQGSIFRVVLPYEPE